MRFTTSWIAYQQYSEDTGIWIRHSRFLRMDLRVFLVKDSQRKSFVPVQCLIFTSLSGPRGVWESKRQSTDPTPSRLFKWTKWTTPEMQNNYWTQKTSKTRKLKSSFIIWSSPRSYPLQSARRQLSSSTNKWIHIFKHMIVWSLLLCFSLSKRNPEHSDKLEILKISCLTGVTHPLSVN